MPQEPKKRHSRQKQGKRRQAIKLSILKTVKCKNCGKKIKAHSVCKYCGFYKGKEVVKTEKLKVERRKKEDTK